MSPDTNPYLVQSLKIFLLRLGSIIVILLFMLFQLIWPVLQVVLFAFYLPLTWLIIQLHAMLFFLVHRGTLA